MVSKELPFEPCLFLGNPHQQGYFSTLISWGKAPISTPQIIPLSDGDKLVMEITTPEGWEPGDPIVLAIHGLCGSHQSTYLVRMVQRLEPKGFKIARFNMRGCGSGKGLARNFYHSGRSEDLFEALKVLKKEFPSSPITVVGCSLGGNVVLKMMGELGSLGKFFVSKVIAISPSVDMMRSSLLMEEVAQGVYGRYFYKLLRKHVMDLHQTFKELPSISLPKRMSLYQFDEMFTAPRLGFSSVQDYYAKCSAIHVIDEITPPCKILFAEDDPIVSHNSLDNHRLPSNIEIYKTKKGGHMGYLGNPAHPRGFFWLDSLLEEWILEDL